MVIRRPTKKEQHLTVKGFDCIKVVRIIPAMYGRYHYLVQLTGISYLAETRSEVNQMIINNYLPEDDSKDCTRWQ